MRGSLEKARNLMLEMLARREHSAWELERKLVVRGYALDLIHAALAELGEANLQSDRRFTENYIRSRTERGFGPRRIALELKSRGISDALIADCLAEEVSHWDRRAREVRGKRFGQTPPHSHQEQARQERFLHYRGFTPEQASRAVSERDN
jgi:regulatory protein